METTVVLIKPDGIRKRVGGEVIKRFEEAGLTLRACKMMRLSEALLRDHYAHLTDLPFFPEILEFMQSSPVLALALEGPGAIGKVRDMVGPTDSTQAETGTIRGDLGEDKMKNIVHASDSTETANAELERFFDTNEVF